MNTKSYPFFGFIIIMMLFSSLGAQNDSLSIFMENTTVEVGEVVELDVHVKDYSNILSTSFTLKWDSLQLRFVDVQNIALGLSFDESAFNVLDAGSLRYLFWDSSVGDGVSLDDNESLFTLVLQAIALENIITPICFEGLVDVVNVDEMELTAETPCTDIDITVMVDATNVGEYQQFTASINPNPFTGNALVALEIPVGGKLTWTVSEMNGQLLKGGVTHFAAGKQVLNLQNTLFKHTGSYILKVEMAGLTLSKKLIYIEP